MVGSQRFWVWFDGLVIGSVVLMLGGSLLMQEWPQWHPIPPASTKLQAPMQAQILSQPLIEDTPVLVETTTQESQALAAKALTSATKPKTPKAPKRKKPAAPAKWTTPTAGHLLDINQATLADWQHLKGIGPATAQRIIEYRKANGPFKTVYELDRVKGIGPKTLAKLKPFLKIS